jgi:membrane protease YdiL (CAAX protease family)
VALMILMGSFVAPLIEEAGFRGYFQAALEREFRGPVAVVIASVLFALAAQHRASCGPSFFSTFL